ncbi:hypothetical protein [Acidisphaera sp. S103]|uniref:hypothetical protein n=1 Tax=Acidisphaera sp. S103 TaxID=1747223 RepID=UPI001C2059C0|nr:hypothetical protein [Acidisphaera sp. S103]
MSVHDGAAIAEALTDPSMFGPHFRGPSWDAWRAFVAALFAAPMTDVQMATFQQCTGRTVAPVTPFTEAALVVGRRGGKSRVLAFVAVALAVLRDYEEHLSAGEVATVGVLASTTKQGRSIFNYVLGLLREIPSLAPMIVGESNDTILLSNRVQIEIAAASFRSTRGYTYCAVLADEIAFWRSEESLNPDVEILRALRPGLASIPGSIMLLASSPYAKKGALYNSYRRHYGRDDARVLVWKAPTETMNPRIDPAIIAEAYDEDPEAARAEYGAEFRDDLADFITREAIDAITMWGRHELPMEQGVTYRAFVDPSGGASDSMCLAIAHQDGDRGVLDALLEIRPPFDPDIAVADCSALLKRYGIARIVGDHYAGLWPVARFREHGITFEQSARGKSDIYADFLPLATSGRVELLDHKRMAAQFVSLERRTGRSGKDSIAEPKGAHDDCCNVVAGVLVGLDLDRRPALIRQQQLLTDDTPLPLPMPGHALGCFATLCISKVGEMAVVYTAPTRDGPLLILDFDVGPLSNNGFSLVVDRLLDLGKLLGVSREAAIALYVEPALVPQARVAGFRAEAIHADYLDAESLLIPVALAVSGGLVKVCQPAHDKAETSPFGGALNFRGGDAATDNPLRTAALQAIALSAVPRRAMRRVQS